ncbi:MAG: glycosyltransferase family 10 [Candidatus Paceibacterota bacterium]
MMKNQMFDEGSQVSKELGGLPVMNRYAALKQFLFEKNIDINTFDIYKNPRKEADIWIMFEPGIRRYLFILKNLINPKKVIFFILEPRVVNPWAWKYLFLYRWLHRTFLSWSSDLAKKHPKQFVEFKVPVPFEGSRHAHFLGNQKRNLCVLMQSNKTSPVPGELYSLRRKIIKYFETRGDSLLDLYGPGWNTKDVKGLGNSNPFYSTLYKGISSDKWETFSEYWFAFCIQNSIPAGDFEYDPFMAMATGTIPIYLPPPNVDEYIPRDTYINYNNFKNLDELVHHLQNFVNTSEYVAMRERGWKYINSEQYRPFTTEKFCEDVYQAIKRTIR